MHGFGITGEWFNVDPEAVISQALQTGAGPNVSDAYTINGLPGPLYNCSSKGTTASNFKSGNKSQNKLNHARCDSYTFLIYITYIFQVLNLDIACKITNGVYIFPQDIDISLNFVL